MYVLGEWGSDITGMEFYHKFTRSIHTTTKSLYDPNLPLWITWDENVNPYLPALICQLKDKQIIILNEITAKHPNNTVEAACRLIID